MEENARDCEVDGARRHHVDGDADTASRTTALLRAADAGGFGGVIYECETTHGSMAQCARLVAQHDQPVSGSRH